MPAVAVGNPQAAAGKPPAVAGKQPAATTPKAASRGRAVAGGHRAKAPAASSGSRQGEQGDGQGGRITSFSEISPLGAEPPGGPAFLTVFFSWREEFNGHYKQNSAALKWFRTRCEREGLDEGFALSNSHVAAVAAMVHPVGTDYSFVEEDMREWSWHEIVAHLDRASLEKVVQDGDPTRGLVGCEFRPRRNSSDHKRQVQPNAPQEQLRDWDFFLVRSDDSAVRLHPDWKKAEYPDF